jgi:two-component system sensor histidine kinase KdpD
VVLFVASGSTVVVAVGTALVAALCLNYFFMAPIGTFTIADPHNWVALVAFLVVAVVASHLSSTARARERDAVERRNEVARLFDVSATCCSRPTGRRHGGDCAPRGTRFEHHRGIAPPEGGCWRLEQGGTAPVDLTRRS